MPWDGALGQLSRRGRKLQYGRRPCRHMSGGAVLIRGVCFDGTSNPVAADLKTAADACAAKGGYLPTPIQLFTIRGEINLGTGVVTIGSSRTSSMPTTAAAPTGRSPSTAPGRWNASRSRTRPLHLRLSARSLADRGDSLLVWGYRRATAVAPGVSIGSQA